MAAVDAATDHPARRTLPAIATLRQVWAEQYTDPPEPPRWREVKDLASAGELIASPDDPEARWSTKREVHWVGYQVHLTETCDADTPHLITHVTTTAATAQDDQLLPTIHTALATEGLLPREHLVDAGYPTAAVLVTSQREHGVTVVGPVALDSSWQAKAGAGFAKAHFVVDWAVETVTCPAGKPSLSWRPVTDPTKDAAFRVRFARRDCLACAERARCTRAKLEPREFMLQPREHHEALPIARLEQTGAAFQARYAARAGIEGTHAQGVRRCGLRQARDLGLAKTTLQPACTAAALNLIRVGEWLAGTPQATTRRSPFAALHLATG